jgi:hyperosmotically inducible protein
MSSKLNNTAKRKSSKPFLKVGFTTCVFLSVMSLSGCHAVLLAGGAGAGYYVGQDDRGVDQIAIDARITAEIKGRFIKEKSVSAFDINVDTRYQVVTLTGMVSSAEVEDKALEIAARVSGVEKVISKITVVKHDQ